MINDTSLPETNPGVHIYKNKPWVLVLNLFSLVFFGAIFGIPVALIIALMSSFNNSNTSYGALEFSLLCIFTPVIALLGLLMLQLIVGLVSSSFSYIRITPMGIEHRVWPYAHIQANWSQVDRLGQLFFFDVIYLKSFEIIGTSLSYSWPFKFLNFSQASIALSTYNGWPNGELASDLKRYAPQIFENQQGAKEGQTSDQNPHVSGISQENRLLAALSHASVLFTGIGIFVPLVIYVTQKQKSTYLAFHALQAFFYQLIGTMFGILFQFCLFGAVMLPAIGITAWRDESAAGSLFITTLIAMGAFTMLLVFGSIAFGVYGIIGAVLAYQGKDFRYAVIGKQVAKRSQPLTRDDA